MNKGITIVGGGLAGLALGIGLRQHGVPVVVHESGSYPRHRVCGEFISGGGQEALVQLGILERLFDAGAISLATAAFFGDGTRVGPHSLPKPALGISRFLLDDWLAREFRRLGGDLCVGSRWTDGFGPGIVRATGRRIQSASEGDWRWFGLKVHARGVELDADLEMHFGASGYVGLSQLGYGWVNICGLFRSSAAIPDLGRRWMDWLGGDRGSVLNSRLTEADLDAASFCSVAGLPIRASDALDGSDCSVGDASTMIPPIAGNGMSMALESAALALEPLTRYGDGSLTWEQVRHDIAGRCDRKFARRLRWAGWLQYLLFRPQARAGLLFLAAHSPGCWRGLFDCTR